MLRVGFYQYRPLFGRVTQNLEKVLNRLNYVNADLMVLPELAFTGYHFRDRSELDPMAEEVKKSSIIAALKELCAVKDMYIVSGFAERDQHRIYNSAVLVGPRGLVHTYRKIQLFFREKELFTPGNIPLQVHDIKGTKVGIMICFDWIFPEIMRILALQGAEIICHPTNLVLSYCQQAMLTRCLENGVFAITTNRFGADNRPHGTLRFTGKSQIVGPKGNLIFRASAQRETIHILEIDPVKSRDKKMTDLNHLFTDRRPEMYRKICEPLS
jgi:predicted amidohydrolase